MNHFNLMKLHNYIINMLIGVLSVVFGGSILFAIFSELINYRDDGSKYAYIMGIIAAVMILAVGVFFIYMAVSLTRRIFSGMHKSDVKAVYEELNSEDVCQCGYKMLVTNNYILVNTQAFKSPVKVIKIIDLIGCFMKPVLAGNDEVYQYIFDIYEDDFCHTQCKIAGKYGENAKKGYDIIVKNAPWIFMENLEEFQKQLNKKEKRRRILNSVEQTKYKMSKEVDTEQLAQEELDAINKEAKEKLDVHQYVPKDEMEKLMKRKADRTNKKNLEQTQELHKIDIDTAELDDLDVETKDELQQESSEDI